MGRQNRQVISITTCPRLPHAELRTTRCTKEDTDTGTNSHIRRLTDEERVQEIAYMLSGATPDRGGRAECPCPLGFKQ